MPALPLGKLAILAVKQVAKPISKGLKNAAINSKIIKNYFILPVAQSVNWIDVKVKTTLMGASGARVHKLNEKVAVEYGAEFISEFFLYALGTAILVWEYGRSVAKEDAKETQIRENTAQLKTNLEKLQTSSLESVFTIAEQAAEIRSLQRQVGQLHTHVAELRQRDSPPP